MWLKNKPRDGINEKFSPAKLQNRDSLAKKKSLSG